MSLVVVDADVESSGAGAPFDESLPPLAGFTIGITAARRREPNCCPISSSTLPKAVTWPVALSCSARYA